MVLFRTLTNGSFTMELDETATIGQVKEKIVVEQSMAAEGLRLIYNGKILSDDETLQSIDVAPNRFIVVVSRNKRKSTEAATASDASSSSSSGLETYRPAAKKALSSTSAQRQHSFVVDETLKLSTRRGAETAQHHVPLTAEQQNSVDQLVDMGYLHDQVVPALRAAFWNAERAVEYLVTGIPESAGNTTQRDAAVANEERGNTTDVNDEERDQAEGAALRFLANHPLFQQMRATVQQDPSTLSSVMRHMAEVSPELTDIVSRNRRAFVAMLNAPASDSLAVIDVSREEMSAVNRLKSMGFSEQLVIEAYLACDRNEDQAVNYMLARMEERHDKKPQNS